jgi:hypothetical protein
MNHPTASSGVGALSVIIVLALVVFFIATYWKIFTKAGQPGWASIIPIYNLWVLIKIAGKPGWWIIMCLIPIVSLIFGILLVVALAERFGKGAIFAIGMILLPFIFYPILAFGDAEYQ